MAAMAEAGPVLALDTGARRRVLDPVDRISEVMFGLIMALTFTCTLSAAEAGRGEVREMLVGALGCNLAWGLVDGVMFTMANLVERARQQTTLRRLRAAKDPVEAGWIIRESLPAEVAESLDAEVCEKIHRRMKGSAETSGQPVLRRDDWLGAIAVFLAVFVSTFPVALPFLLIKDPWLALRVSNGVALLLLFLAGYTLGRYAGHRPWRMGIGVMLVGWVLVGITIALGG